MTCRRYDLGNDTTVFLCSRGRRDLPQCSVPGCRHPGSRLCDFPVVRAGVSGTCDARICEFHAKPVGDAKEFCPPHLKLHQQRGGAR